MSDENPGQATDIEHRDLKDEIEKIVADLAPALVQEAVSKEEDRRFRQLKWIAAFIGVIGLGTFGALANVVIERVVDAKAGNIRETLELTRIYSLALKLNLSDRFSTGDKEEAMTLLLRISQLPAVKASPDVRNALTDVLRSFAAASVGAELDQLFDAYQSEILTTGTSTEILLHHYGQEIIGRPTVPSLEDRSLRRFERLEAVAASHDVRELALAYRLLYDATVARQPIAVRVRSLLSSSLDLPDRDAGRFLREILLRSRSTNWQKEANPEGLQIERSIRGFLETYQREMGEVYRVEPVAMRQIAKEGVSQEQADEFATEFVARARKAQSDNNRLRTGG